MGKTISNNAKFLREVRLRRTSEAGHHIVEKSYQFGHIPNSALKNVKLHGTTQSGRFSTITITPSLLDEMTGLVVRTGLLLHASRKITIPAFDEH